MRKLLILLLTVFLVVSNGIQAQTSQEDYQKKMEWWRDAKFGMFVHWGPYCLYGGMYNGFQQKRGGAEWIMNRCKIPVLEYRAKASTFNPTKFDAEKLVKLAQDAGMKYIVFTSKHHDGFAMFKSEASNFNIVDYTPFKRDILKELADACRKNNMKLGFYYSQSQDWCNPGGDTHRRPMNQGWPNPDSTQIDRYTATHDGSWDCMQQSVSFDEYFYKVSLPQIKEILQNYGDVAVIWWDTPGKRITGKHVADIMEVVKKHPNIIMNDRLIRPSNTVGDYKTPEGLVPKISDVEGVDWETCMTIGSSWGYKSYEKNWKSQETLIRNLITIASRGGNFLLNVGPNPEGLVSQEETERLQIMGKWLQTNGEAIYGTQRSSIYPKWGQCIRKDNKKNSILYLCVFDWPKDSKLILEAQYKIKGASLLSDGSKLKTEATKNGIVIQLPAEAPDKIASVVKLELKEKLPPVKLASNSAKSKTFDIVDEK